MSGSFEQRVEKALQDQGERLLKIETNHLAHIEPDVRYLKESSVRAERVMAEILEELKRSSKDTHELRVDLVSHMGDSKSALMEVRGEVSALKAKEGTNSTWTRDLIMLVIGGLVAAAFVLFRE